MAAHQQRPILVRRNGVDVVGVRDDEITMLADQAAVGPLDEDRADIRSGVLEQTRPFAVGDVHVHGVHGVDHLATRPFGNEMDTYNQ
jgi:hypothetical protein